MNSPGFGLACFRVVYSDPDHTFSLKLPSRDGSSTAVRKAPPAPTLTAPLAHDQSRLMSPALIAIDWGSSSFRAYLMSAEGQVLDDAASGDGIGSVAAGAYPATLKRLIGRWLNAHPSLPVIASGMVGSRHGWREAPYVPLPAGPRDVASHLADVEADGRRVALAPGLVLSRMKRAGT